MQAGELDALLDKVFIEYQEARETHDVSELLWVASQDVFLALKSLTKRLYIIDEDKVALCLWSVELHYSRDLPKRSLLLKIKED